MAEIPAPKDYDVDRFNIAAAQRNVLMEELDKLRYGATPQIGGGKGSHGKGGGALIPSPSDVVVAGSPGGHGPNSIAPLKADPNIQYRANELEKQIALLDGQMRDPAKYFPLAASSEAKRGMATGAYNFSMDPTLRPHMNTPMLTSLLGTGDVGSGNMFSRFLKSMTDPEAAKLMYAAQSGVRGSTNKTLSARLGGGEYDPLRMMTSDDLLRLGVSSGYINLAEAPDVIQRKLFELGAEVGMGQRDVAKRVGQGMQEAGDAVDFNRMIGRGAINTAKVGAGGGALYGLAVGGKSLISDYMDNSKAAAEKAKAAAKKAADRDKKLSKLSQMLFGATTDGFKGLSAAATSDNLSESGLALWDEDVNNLFNSNRTRMYGGLDAKALSGASSAIAALEEQYAPVLQALGRGQADMGDYPKLVEELTRIGSDYGIDFAKTPYFFGTAKKGATRDEFDSGVMIAGEDEANPDGTTKRVLKRYGVKRGKNKLTDFADQERAAMAE